MADGNNGRSSWECVKLLSAASSSTAGSIHVPPCIDGKVAATSASTSVVECFIFDKMVQEQERTYNCCPPYHQTKLERLSGRPACHKDTISDHIYVPW